MKLLIAYDGTLDSKAALRYGIKRLKDEGGSAVVLALFHGAMFVDYGAGPKAEEMARAEVARRLSDARKIIEETGKGLWIRVEERDGEPNEEILDMASELNFDAVLAPARYKSAVGAAPCPVITFPGTVLVPVDNTGYSPAALERIIGEALGTNSRAVLLGVVPTNMYGASEAAELGRVEKETKAALRRLKKELESNGVKTVEAMRPGYPDEEILRAIDEFAASMVIIPTAEDTPSEVAKAAEMIREEDEKGRRSLALAPKLS